MEVGSGGANMGALGGSVPSSFSEKESDMRRLVIASFGALVVALLAPSLASAQRVLAIEYTPTRRAQIAVWITQEDGTFLETLSLTQSVSYFGIGNRPGALQMNSGYRWPYGRREGVLPVWAHARASAPGAALFPRVIFQDRDSEGYASRSSVDFSPDDHFCLAFMGRADATLAGLDAVSCASVFMSDKGRYVTDDDVAAGYREPAESAPGVQSPHALDRFSLYPPRRDTVRCVTEGCFDHADVDRYQADALAVMPELDAITAATPPGETPQLLMFSVPEAWPDGRYHVYVEVNTEGDYAPGWDDARFPTPLSDRSRPVRERWDGWAETWGYPYRGQPSLVYRLTVEIGPGVASVGAAQPIGYGSIDGRGSVGGVITSMDGTIADDPVRAPGSGVDRLHEDESGFRVRVRSQGAEACLENAPPSRIEGLVVSAYHERRDAHRFAHLEMIAPSDDLGLALYEVRFSETPITDEASFVAARPANAATIEIQALEVPTSARAGELVAVDLGGLSFERHYWIAARARDHCNAAGEIAVTEYTTPPIEFTTVSPCFVATAAYGTPMADEVGVLRRFRDRQLLTNPAGRELVALYYALGPELAEAIAGSDTARSLVRGLLSPIVGVARALE